MIEGRGGERRLVRRMLAGDEAAFQAFFDAYFSPLYRFALKRAGGDAEAAEEVVQRTLCIAIDRVASWRGEAQLLTWLCAICRRELSGYFRTLNRAPARVELTEELPEVRAALESLGPGELDPEMHALQSEVVDLVHVALDSVPAHYGRVLEWMYLEGATMKEIAVRLATTPKAVESMLTRARNAYRDALASLLGQAPVAVVDGGRDG